MVAPLESLSAARALLLVDRSPLGLGLAELFYFQSTVARADLVGLAPPSSTNLLKTRLETAV